jgi:hypothetical protein
MRGCYFDLQLKKKKRRKKGMKFLSVITLLNLSMKFLMKIKEKIFLLVSPLTNYNKPNTDGIIDIIFIYFFNFFIMLT